MALVLSIFSLKGGAQIIQGTLIFGGNLSQVDGDEVFGYNHLGLNVGAAAIVPFGENWSVSLEALYSQKGAHRRAQNPGKVLDGFYDYDLHYAEIPVLLHYTDKDVLTFGAGFSYNRLIDYKEVDRRTGALEHVAYESEPSSHDVQFLADLRFRLYKQLKMDLRYAYSLLPFRQADFYWRDVDVPEHRKQYNNVMTVRLMWVINERQSRKIQRETEIYNDLE